MKMPFAKFRICLPALLFAACALPLCGCGRRHNETAGYDLRRSEELLGFGETMLEVSERGDKLTDLSGLGVGVDSDDAVSRNDEATKGLSRLVDAYRRQYEIFTAAQVLLAEGRFQDLATAINDAEKRGEATPELLKLRDFPKAMHALRIFCARRPYESAVDLEHALYSLQPYEVALEKSERFRAFRQEQNELKDRLSVIERASAVAELMTDLDDALANGVSRAEVRSLVSQMHDANPNAALLQYLDADTFRPSEALLALLRGEWRNALSEQEQEAVELALALCLPSLDGAENRRLAEAFLSKMPETITLTGTAMKAAVLKDITLLDKAICRWFEAAGEERRRQGAPAFLRQYIELCGLRGQGGRGGAVKMQSVLAAVVQWVQVE